MVVQVAGPVPAVAAQETVCQTATATWTSSFLVQTLVCGVVFVSQKCVVLCQMESWYPVPVVLVLSRFTPPDDLRRAGAFFVNHTREAVTLLRKAVPRHALPLLYALDTTVKHSQRVCDAVVAEIETFVRRVLPVVPTIEAGLITALVAHWAHYGIILRIQTRARASVKRLRFEMDDGDDAYHGTCSPVICAQTNPVNVCTVCGDTIPRVYAYDAWVFAEGVCSDGSCRHVECVL